VIERPGPDGRPERFLSPLEPKAFSKDSHTRFGVGPFDAALVDGVLDGSPAKAQGLQKGDIIEKANGQIVDMTTFVEMVESVPEGGVIALEVRRDGTLVPIAVQPQTVGRFLGAVFVGGASGPRAEEGAPVVAALTEEAQQNSPLKPKDIVERVDGQPVTLAQLREIERTRPGQTLHLDVRRPAVLFGLLRQASTFTADVTVNPVRAIGVKLGIKTVFHQVPLSLVVPEAFRLSWRAMDVTARTFHMLISGRISPKELGGPVMIYQTTTAAAHAGYMGVVKITAFISVNLCVFNLLPLPVLDGSLLVFLALEAIRRKPLNVRVLERVQQVGLVMIVGLMLYVTYNDVARWLQSLVP
jgi:regulator of sigma E protease